MLKIKICGITREEDAQAAVDLGVDALGFNFFEKSPRCIALKQASEIMAKLPAEIWKVGIFVDAQVSQLRAILDEVPLDTIQFHGAESAEFCNSWHGYRLIKALRAAPGLEISPEAKRFASSVNFLLFDSFDAEKFGGTGNTVPDAVLDGLWQAGALSRAFISGGLTPENVGKVLAKYQPFGVDVASGVESSPGIKDRKKLGDFVKAVRKRVKNGA